MLRKTAMLVAVLALMAWSAGCRVRTEKGANGEDKSVQVDTPFGGVHVNTNETKAADLGLPAYPGAEISRNDDKHGSADVHMGFGEWQLRVRAVPYTSSDSQDKVAAFYKKAMERFGDVITCQGNAPVGTPTVTAEGLDCSDSGKNTHVNVNGQGDGMDFSGDLQLKAGSKHHQHIVGFETPKDGNTHYALVAIDLPSGIDTKDDKSD
ncbi:MAG TPA: hypothetical protein VHW46_08315 [Terracidiphilus sp.]|jgi:hypothetical protein|nr:hypothetical protein [Terracidiphilus sp.]